jgi:cytochrome P450
MDNVFLKNPIILLLDRLGISLFQFPVAKFAKARIAERLLKLKNGENAAATQKPDLLSKFLKAQQDRPEIMTDRRVLSLAVSMTFAGSETTAISLSAVFYYLLKNPSCYAKLQAELDKAVQDGVVQDRPSKVVSWTEAQQLPYLDACVKEAFRMHPAAGLPLERFTPPEGIEIEGHMIPGGTIVGCNAWVVHKNEDIFGARVDDYIPERWINTDLEHVKQMEGSLFQFGAGSRTCIGKNISLLEIYKLIPSFMRRFDVSYEHIPEVLQSS